jgi:hypothetical protein
MRILARALIVALVMPASVSAQTLGSAEENLKKKNISLPTPATPVANYVPAVRVGSLLFLSGAGPAPSDPRGKVGKDLTLDQGYQAARSTCLNLLAPPCAGQKLQQRQLGGCPGCETGAGGQGARPGGTATGTTLPQKAESATCESGGAMARSQRSLARSVKCQAARWYR